MTTAGRTIWRGTQQEVHNSFLSEEGNDRMEWFVPVKITPHAARLWQEDVVATEQSPMKTGILSVSYEGCPESI